MWGYRIRGKMQGLHQWERLEPVLKRKEDMHGGTLIQGVYVNAVTRVPHQPGDLCILLKQEVAEWKDGRYSYQVC